MSNYENMPNRESMRMWCKIEEPGYVGEYRDFKRHQSDNDSKQKARMSRERRQQRRQRGK